MVSRAVNSGVSQSVLSDNAYNLLIGAVLMWGFAVNWYLVETVPTSYLQSLSPWVLFGGYFASCIAGIVLTSASSNPWVSFIGYNLVVVPMGLILNLIVSRFSPDTVSMALQTTVLVTFGMMVLSSIFPRFFAGLGGYLFWGLLIAIVVEVIQTFVFGIHTTVMDWIVALIFCGYIGYDWHMAQSVEKTADNAVDMATHLYMDIINLFVRLLEILED